MARTICGHGLRTYFAFMLLSTKRKGITFAVVIGIFLKDCNVLNCDTRLELLTSQRVASIDRVMRLEFVSFLSIRCSAPLCQILLCLIYHPDKNNNLVKFNFPNINTTN